MQALSDEQQMERLEKKVDDGFAAMKTEFREMRTDMKAEFRAVRSEARSDFRLLLGILLPMYLTIILGLAALLLQHHL